MARRLVYWDSDAFLALLNGDKTASEMQGCLDVWTLGQKGLIHIVTSTLTVAEVIHMKGTPKLDPTKRHLVSNFFRQHFISLKPLTREIAELARDVVWDSNIRPKDAVHVATAGYYKLRELHSFDGNLVGKQVVSVQGFDIAVKEPHAQAQAEIQIEELRKAAGEE
jgi:predicted nucleic acid-binding protein